MFTFPVLSDIERMTGVRPGLYWQIMWRFVSPVLMAVVIMSSIYFMFKHTPTYTAWDGDQAMGVRREYPTWALVTAAILAVSSLVPIVIGAGIYLVNRSSDSRNIFSALLIFLCSGLCTAARACTTCATTRRAWRRSSSGRRPRPR